MTYTPLCLVYSFRSCAQRPSRFLFFFITSNPGHMHLHPLPLSHPEPRPFLPNCCQEHLGSLSFILLITLLRSRCLCCSIISPVCWLRYHRSLLMFRANSAAWCLSGFKYSNEFLWYAAVMTYFYGSFTIFLWIIDVLWLQEYYTGDFFLPFINSLYSYSIFSRGLSFHIFIQFFFFSFPVKCLPTSSN